MIYYIDGKECLLVVDYLSKHLEDINLDENTRLKTVIDDLSKKKS